MKIGDKIKLSPVCEMNEEVGVLQGETLTPNGKRWAVKLDSGKYLFLREDQICLVQTTTENRTNKESSTAESQRLQSLHLDESQRK